LVVARPGGHRDAAFLVELIKQEQITTLHFVPAMLQVFLAAEGVEACTSLRRVICSGEALARELQDRFFARLPQVELHNLYGPTEAAVDVTFWACDAAGNHTAVPIGRPVANTQIYLVDKYNQLVPVGVPGELYIGGVQLARGYHKRAALSAERFVPDPFSGVPGARLYRTGDLARYLSDGSIEYLGRLDFQVKIRGFRVELGEIEAALGEHPIVRDVVVVMREDTPQMTNDKRIVAYVVLNRECAAPADELRRTAKDKLPSFMIPASFVFLPELPLTPNGKIDRGSLPAPEQQMIGEPAGGYVAPRDLVEELIAVVWATVLGVERVGIHDNFFELGGHSILGAQVISRVQKAFKTELPLRLLFEFPTVAAFAEQMAAIRKDDVATPPPIEPVSRTEDLPLSFAQQRLWFLDQLEPGLPAYNMPGAVRISGVLDRAVLEKSLSEIVRRH
jgi:acyl carrier protein